MALRCYRCGASLEALTLPLSRLDLCPDCFSALHCCRMCRHYAPAAPDACTEEDAEEVRDKSIANFCDYFAPSAEAFTGAEREAEARARSALDELFERGGDARSDAAPQGTDSADDATEAARREADALFKK